MVYSAGLRHSALLVSLLAFSLTSALPAEHLHESGTTSTDAPVVHRHLDGVSHLSHEFLPGDDGDHATPRPVGTMFQASPKFAPVASGIVEPIALIAPDPGVPSDLVFCDAVTAHGPPLRLLPSRAPPAQA